MSKRKSGIKRGRNRKPISAPAVEEQRQTETQEEKTVKSIWKDRLKFALCNGGGYVIAAILVVFIPDYRVTLAIQFGIFGALVISITSLILITKIFLPKERNRLDGEEKKNEEQV